MRVVSDPVQITYVASSEAFVVGDVHLVPELVSAVERTKVRATDGKEVRAQTTHRSLPDVRQNDRDPSTD